MRVVSTHCMPPSVRYAAEDGARFLNQVRRALCSGRAQAGLEDAMRRIAAIVAALFGLTIAMATPASADSPSLGGHHA
jgi:hypothetical protein